MQVLGTVFGLAGALLVSQNSANSKWGWVAFLASNVFLIAMATRKKLWVFCMLQLGFSYTSINGILNFF